MNINLLSRNILSNGPISLDENTKIPTKGKNRDHNECSHNKPIKREKTILTIKRNGEVKEKEIKRKKRWKKMKYLHLK